MNMIVFKAGTLIQYSDMVITWEGIIETMFGVLFILVIFIVTKAVLDLGGFKEFLLSMKNAEYYNLDEIHITALKLRNLGVVDDDELVERLKKYKYMFRRSNDENTAEYGTVAAKWPKNIRKYHAANEFAEIVLTQDDLVFKYLTKIYFKDEDYKALKKEIDYRKTKEYAIDNLKNLLHVQYQGHVKEISNFMIKACTRPFISDPEKIYAISVGRNTALLYTCLIQQNIFNDKINVHKYLEVLKKMSLSLNSNMEYTISEGTVSKERSNIEQSEESVKLLNEQLRKLLTTFES